MLPVMATVREAFSIVTGNFRECLRAAALPWAGCVASATAVKAIYGFPDPAPLVWNLQWSLVHALALGMFAVAWHRRILLGELVHSVVGCHRAGLYHAPFLLWSLALCLLSVPDLPGESVALLGFRLLAPLFVFYVLARLSLALPSAAIGEGGNAIQAWRLSQGSVFALTAIPIIAAIGAFICFIPVALLAKALLPESLMLIATYVLWFMIAAVEVSALRGHSRITSDSTRERSCSSSSVRRCIFGC